MVNVARDEVRLEVEEMFNRVKRSWAALRGQDVPPWTPEQIDSINAEMADQILAEIRQTLAEVGCRHGHDMDSTPAMFYREAILCALSQARKESTAACIRHLRRSGALKDGVKWTG